MSSDWPYAGARWWKFDFHTHTPASSDTRGWQAAIGLPNEVTPERWLLKYMAAGIDCIAITDHNSGAWIDALKAAYDQMKANPPAGFRELHLFPGVEISVNGGFHLLALFPKSAKTSDVDSLLGKIDYSGTKGDSDGVTRKSAVEVVEAVLGAGGIAIPAHVDQPKGLLQLAGTDTGKAVLDANTLKQVFELDRLLAMEVVDRAALRPEVYREADCGWSEVLGSDCHDFVKGPQPGVRFTWVKMAEPTLEGLRLALLDGAHFSIRRSDDPTAFSPFHLPEHFIESVSVANARYMGHGQTQELRLSPWFNALVGGRGTGKSTVVHGLRLAYHREGELLTLPQGNDARQTFERFMQEPLGRNDDSGALDYRSTRKTEIIVTLIRDGVRHRLRWRQDSKEVSVEEQVGGLFQLSASQSVTADRFPVRIFSQGQIAALAGGTQEALLAVIDEAAKVEPVRNALLEAKQRFFALRARYREIAGKLKGRDDVQVKLSDVQRKLANFEGKQNSEVLKAFQLRSKQEREVDRQVAESRRIAATLKDVAKKVAVDEVPEGLFDPNDEADREALAIIERLHASAAESAQTVTATAAKLEAAVQEATKGEAVSAWSAKLAEAKSNYAALVEELKKQGVSDPSEYRKLVEERELAEEQVAQLQSLAEQQDEIAGELTKQRTIVLEARQALSQVRRDFLAKQLSQNPYVRIELVPYGRDARGTERAIREVLGVIDERFGDDILTLEDDEMKSGLVSDLLKDLADNASSAATIESRLGALAERFVKASSGHGDFGGRFNNYLERESAARPELMDRLQVWSPEDGLQVEYSPKGDGKDFRSIRQASAGQRAAAMLAFLLAHGSEPLVLDQPEDDLDNHLIYDLVVQQIRANKLRRQILVVTHNANVVVNGDAEMLHALDFRGGQCRIVVKGSLQEPSMREEVCRVMEGGREAFERRYKRLGRDA